MTPLRPLARALLLLLLAAGCAVPDLRDAAGTPGGPRWIAHRGNSTEAPENTLAAVRAALDLEPLPHAIEVDVHATADGALVVLHDTTLERTTDLRGEVAERTLAEVRRASAGYAERFGSAFAGERVPLLEEVLDAAAATETCVMIEVKAYGLGADVARLLELRGETDRHVVASFKPSVLVHARMQSPGLRTLYLSGRPEREEVELARLLGAELLGFHHEPLTAEAVRAAHAAGLEVWTYTVNDPVRAAECLRLGVDGVISDRVGPLRAALAP